MRLNAKHRFSLKTVIQIGVQLVDRLQQLHDKGFLHSDLKPENIMINEDIKSP